MNWFDVFVQITLERKVFVTKVTIKWFLVFENFCHIECYCICNYKISMYVNLWLLKCTEWKLVNGTGSLVCLFTTEFFYQCESRNFFIDLTSDSTRPDSSIFLYEVYTCFILLETPSKGIWISSQNGFVHCSQQISAWTMNQKRFLKWFYGWLLINIRIHFFMFG